MRTSVELIDLVAVRGEAFATFIEGLDEASFRRRPAEAAWSAAELAGHVSEFPRTFALDAARLAANPGAGVGRNLDDEGRLAALGRIGDRSPAEAAELVREAIAAASAVLGAIPGDGWAVEGVRVVNGEVIAVSKLIETFVAGHLALHLKQAQEAVAC